MDENMFNIVKEEVKNIESDKEDSTLAICGT